MSNHKAEMTPKEIVEALNKYIIGQEEAKKVVAVALRNRYRRSRLSEKDREEITPKNIILKDRRGLARRKLLAVWQSLLKRRF